MREENVKKRLYLMLFLLFVLLSFTIFVADSIFNFSGSGYKNNDIVNESIRSIIFKIL